MISNAKRLRQPTGAPSVRPATRREVAAGPSTGCRQATRDVNGGAVDKGYETGLAANAEPHCLALEIDLAARAVASDLLADREGVAQRPPNPVVLPVARRKDDRQHFQDVRQAGGVQRLLVGFHVENLADELGVQA